jgi:hypothetical protein
MPRSCMDAVCVATAAMTMRLHVVGAGPLPCWILTRGYAKRPPPMLAALSVPAMGYQLQFRPRSPSMTTEATNT